LTDYPASLPFTGFVPGNWAPRGTFTAPKGAIFIHDNSTQENGFPTNGGHWWVADGATALCRMSLDSTGHWVIPPGLPGNLCANSVVGTPGQFDYDAARSLIYVPDVKTSVWRLHLAENPDGSGKEIVSSVEVRPTSNPLPEGSGLDALTLSDGGTFFYVTSKSNPNVWACINPSDPTLATTRCKQIANSTDGKKLLDISYNHVTHSLFLGQVRGVTEIKNVDACFALTTPCLPQLSQITFAGPVLQPQSMVSFGRFLYIGDENGNVFQANVDTSLFTDPNAQRVLIYGQGFGGFVTGLGVDPVDGLQIFTDPLLKNVNQAALVTRLPLCPATP
jgi:hypothetical protein